MKKHIFVTNGMARCGKDTFAQFLGEIVPVAKYSSIDRIKEISRLVGWDGVIKTEKERKLWSDMKSAFTEYSDFPFRVTCERIDEFLADTENMVLLIDVREASEIEKLKKSHGVLAILIKNDNVKTINSNESDKNVFNYDYDFVIENNGTLEEFRQKVKTFAEMLEEA